MASELDTYNETASVLSDDDDDDDEVFMEAGYVSEGGAEAYSSLIMDSSGHQLAPGAANSRMATGRRSSIFDVALLKPTHCGSSITSFAHEPVHEDVAFKPKTKAPSSYEESVTASSSATNTSGSQATSSAQSQVNSLRVDCKYGESSTTFSYEPQLPVGRNEIQYENTYQMSPPHKFRPDPVKKIIVDMLEHSLHDRHYDPIGCAIASKNIAQEIKNKVKAMEFERYKIVCTVSIGEKKDQGVQFGSRCVWNKEWDTYATASFENAHIYAVGIVYALYYE